LRGVEYPDVPSHLTARGNDLQTIVHDETDRTDFSTRLGQEVLLQRWRSAKSSNDPTRVFQFGLRQGRKRKADEDYRTC